MSKCVRYSFFVFLNTIALFLGAAMFMFSEYKFATSIPKKNKTELRVSIDQLVGFKINATTFNAVFKKVSDYVHVKEDCKSLKYERGWKKNLNVQTFVRWCYFTYTVVTTIGYGDVVVESDFGKIFLGIYAILAIPLHMYTSYLVGKVITWLIKSLLYCVELHFLKRTTVQHKEGKVLFLSLLLSILWTLACSLIIVKAHDWSVIDSVYFSLVSMLTIGFGDFTLDTRKLDFIEIYLSWHLYVGTSMLAPLINGLLEFFKRTQVTAKYSVSTKKTYTASKNLELKEGKFQHHNLSFENGTMAKTEQVEKASEVQS